MTMKKIYRKWKTLKDFNRSLYIEYICLCNFASVPIILTVLETIGEFLS